MSDSVRILLVDKDNVALRNLEIILRKDGCFVTSITGAGAAIKYLESRASDLNLFDVVLADLGLDSLDEGHFLDQCMRLQPACALIFISDKITVTSVVDVIRQGAFHYLIKPISPQELRQTVTLAAENSRHRQMQQGICQELVSKRGSQPLITNDLAMLRLLEQARKAAIMELPILITGETGTGKEILARFLHDASLRNKKPFVAINCGAFNEELLVNELFGHGRAAFTGAFRDHKGLVETAHGGTLFLDEITEMSLNMQVKLLRVIQEKELRRLGVTTPVTIDVRFIAATNRPIQQEVEAGRFRRDLYYRLNVIDFYLPPLSDRQGDIPVLVHHFLEKHSKDINPIVTGISKPALDRLCNYSFPGNVRELENILQRAMAFATGSDVTENDLPNYIVNSNSQFVFQNTDRQFLSLEDMEAKYILWVCDEVKGNQTMAAKILGLDRVSLWRRLKKIQLEA
ncbi:MAG: sigma-54-dependent Fis family transcriptional regulator [Magnetococcales bacterium]|nr:sigma-54-dependent Fis family transcriptional regulator [Magnetococcales bacterium]MBF0438827.1 sigma-54-dependent Fis family transcriptional regulator [Magnetococcales bacterium]